MAPLCFANSFGSLRQLKSLFRQALLAAMSIAVLAMAGPTPAHAAGASFQALGFLPGGQESFAYGISINADGSVVVGAAKGSYQGFPGPYYQAVQWTASGGLTSIGILPNVDASWGFAVSGDGTVIGGTSGLVNSILNPSQDPGQAFRWTKTFGMTAQGFLPGTTKSSFTGANTDGSIMVGFANNGFQSSEQAFRWGNLSGMVGLGQLSSAGWSHAYGVSADGNTVVGASTYPGGGIFTGEAFR